MQKSTAKFSENKSGSALIMVLWTVIIMSLLIGTFAYEMHIEAKIATLERQQFKAKEIANAGYEYARALLNAPALESDSAEEGSDLDNFQNSADQIRNGMGVSELKYDLSDGYFELSILPENGKRKIGDLMPEEWNLLLDECGIDVTEQDKLIDCYTDWVDEGDLHALNGAESDDEFYVEHGYACKNAPLETIEELLLIKNFTKTILYGGVDENGDEITGIADKLTVWDDGKININTASREVLMTVFDLDQATIDDIIELRNGPDGIAGNEDDGFASLDEIGLGHLDKEFTNNGSIMLVKSRGVVESFCYEINAVIKTSDESDFKVLSWDEAFVPRKNVSDQENQELDQDDF